MSRQGVVDRLRVRAYDGWDIRVGTVSGVEPTGPVVLAVTVPVGKGRGNR